MRYPHNTKYSEQEYKNTIEIKRITLESETSYS
jgi:hypothetical protein